MSKRLISMINHLFDNPVFLLLLAVVCIYLGGVFRTNSDSIGEAIALTTSFSASLWSLIGGKWPKLPGED
jgi:hypothetical protein